jgi:hypothetical protein
MRMILIFLDEIFILGWNREKVTCSPKIPCQIGWDQEQGPFFEIGLETRKIPSESGLAAAWILSRCV